jgi:hypothetical protein
MAVQVQAPTRRKRDLFDVILGGLQAASAITNIQKAQLELESVPEAKARLQRSEERQFATQFKEVPEGTAGAISLAPPGEERRGLFLPRAEIAARVEKARQATKEARETQEFKQKQETSLRNEWLKNPQTKITQDVSTAVGKVRKVGTGKPSAAGDLSLIFNYMKLLDPGSVVREGEFATAQNAAGIPDRVVNLYNNLLRGERLNPAQRRDFVGRADQLYDVHLERQKAFNQEFERISKAQDLDPKMVVLDLKFEPVKKKKTLIPKDRSVLDDIGILNRNLERDIEARPETEGALESDLDEFRSLIGQ